jgi:hypothetical protein
MLDAFGLGNPGHDAPFEHADGARLSAAFGRRLRQDAHQTPGLAGCATPPLLDRADLS